MLHSNVPESGGETSLGLRIGRGKSTAGRGRADEEGQARTTRGTTRGEWNRILGEELRARGALLARETRAGRGVFSDDCDGPVGGDGAGLAADDLAEHDAGDVANCRWYCQRQGVRTAHGRRLTTIRANRHLDEAVLVADAVDGGDDSSLQGARCIVN